MPDIGLIELILIGIVAFLELGPERLPEFMRQVSTMLRSVREWVANVKRQVDLEARDLQQPLQQSKDALSEGISSFSTELAKDIKTVATEVKAVDQRSDQTSVKASDQASS